MSKQTFMVGIPTKYKTFDEWLDDHDRKVRKKVIQEVKDNVGDITWYHIHNGQLVEGANSEEDTPLYKYVDIKALLENLKNKVK